ncbi:MAG: biotin carboxylase N-terminal domain-containing protein [Acidimicrobiales bacterium]
MNSFEPGHFTRPLRTVIVANRGEIARRVFRTARAMGLRTVAVFADADADAPFVRDADQAIRLPGGYLDGASIIAAALAVDADALHPGYGFLSENAGFAEEVIRNGIRWVGPMPEVIAAMGDKLAAKRAAVDAGVPTLPSAEDPADAASVGYPLLVKASAGGGGKGMRIVERAEDLEEAVAAARREAKSGFGDDTVFLERYVRRARHVEIQVLGDEHGTLLHLGERECSIQRRHQKVIEESPSPVVDEAMRAAMGDAALSLCRAIGYTSTGTVEFLVDDDTREFFFLEVNTRLQVEHPVTELVTGIDLVREQLRVAAGQPISPEAAATSPSGHAIEARLYAEDPANGFLPAIGTLAAFAPAAEPAVRWDSGVQAGSVVGVDFDPMLAKVVAHAPTRDEAASRLALALERLHVGGVTTNRDFLAAVLRSSAFLEGDTTTDFIERTSPDLAVEPDEEGLERLGAVAALWLQGRNRRDATIGATLPSGWRNSPMPPQQVGVRWGELEAVVRYQARRDGSFAVGDGSVAIVHRWADDEIDVELDGHRGTARVTLDGDRLHLSIGSSTATLELVPRFTVPGPAEVAGGFVAPMPGVVLAVRVAAGDAVSAGQTLVVLEAMKMEHHMAAPADGVVAEVRVAAGDQVANGAMLLVFEPEGDGEGEAG